MSNKVKIKRGNKVDFPSVDPSLKHELFYADDESKLYITGKDGNYNIMENTNSLLGAGSSLPTDGLILHYTFENVSGSTVVDETGNYDGTMTAHTIVSGHSGDGVKLTVSGSGNISFPTGFSIRNAAFSCWFKIDSKNHQFPLYGSLNNQHRISYYTVGNFFDAGNASPALGLSNLFNANIGEWYHVVMNITDTSTDIYINGSSVMTGPDSVIVNGTITTIGGQNSGANDAGSLDKVRIYNRVLTPEEITALYEEV
jgi:trimeric autotransporter adhesin